MSNKILKLKYQKDEISMHKKIYNVSLEHLHIKKLDLTWLQFANYHGDGSYKFYPDCSAKWKLLEEIVNDVKLEVYTYTTGQITDKISFWSIPV
ncbi:MAG: hypothetical protein U0525_02250 [Patescibacteria group bacterium]